MGRVADAVVVAKDGLDADFRGGRIVPVRNYAPAPVRPPRRHAAGPLMVAHLGAIGRMRGWPQMLDALAQGEAMIPHRKVAAQTRGLRPPLGQGHDPRQGARAPRAAGRPPTQAVAWTCAAPCAAAWPGAASRWRRPGKSSGWSRRACSSWPT